MNTRKFLAISIAVHTSLMLTAYAGLVTAFDFPDILREPTGVYLARFLSERAVVVACYAAFTWSQVAFVVVALAIGEHFRTEAGGWLRLATPLGAIAGFAQAVGFSRWIFVVPSLAEGFEAQPDVTTVAVDLLHRFAGVAVGEHLFFCFEALWAVMLGVHLLGAGAATHVSRRAAQLLILIGGLIGLYAFEQFSGPFAVLGPVNVAAHAALLLWLVGLAITQWTGRGLRGLEVVLLGAAWAVLVVPSWL